MAVKMDLKLATMILICFLLFTALVFLPSPVSQDVDESEYFNYNETSGRGPSNWGDLRPEWRLCKNGTMQSPIDLLSERVQIVPSLRRLQLNYHPANATLTNRGHDIKLEWVTGAGYLQINETKYELKQVHWHSPSEHAIDGKRFDLELHMVHETPSGEIAVIGILYEIGINPDLFLLSLTTHLRAISNKPGAESVVGIVDPRQINLLYKQYYRYMGSLTTPPCYEDVVWTILKEIRPVTKEQVTLLGDAVDDESESNARPLQPLNNRLLQLYGPNFLENAFGWGIFLR